VIQPLASWATGRFRVQSIGGRTIKVVCQKNARPSVEDVSRYDQDTRRRRCCYGDCRRPRTSTSKDAASAAAAGAAGGGESLVLTSATRGGHRPRVNLLNEWTARNGSSGDARGGALPLPPSHPQPSRISHLEGRGRIPSAPARSRCL